MANDRYYPIIYVRGYAMTDAEKDETAADPFCGLNVGSTVYRAVADKTKPAQRFFFESTVVRLMTDFGYSHVYESGLDFLDPGYAGQLSTKSIIIFRYYDETAPLVGGTSAPSIPNFAAQLAELILSVKQKVCAKQGNQIAPSDFKCYLVAHSMGGLICRAMLQDPHRFRESQRAVDKIFTYATPHNGIEMAGINVPRWLSVYDINTFNRETLAPILNLDAEYKATRRVDWVTGQDAPGIDRYFCMIGSNRADYQAALGLSRTFSGHGGDGLVKIANASVSGLSQNGEKTPAAQAYAYRSHSGYFGIVNSEEAYQNLTRFLFGDIRVDIWVEITGVRLPPALEGKEVDALYQFEVLASTRGSPWYLTRRIAEEDSVACRTHKELIDPNSTERRRVYLSSVFMADWAKVDREDESMAYSLTLGIRVPDYEVEGKLWLKDHYEGTYLYRDTVIVQIKPDNNGRWSACYGWQSSSPSQADTQLDLIEGLTGQLRGEANLLDSNKAPDVDGKIIFDIRPWNV